MESAAGKVLAVVGAGALGQVIASCFARAGERVWLLASEGSAARMRAAGGIELRGAIEATTPVGDEPAPGVVGLADAPGAVHSVGGLLFATKAHQLAAAGRFWAGVRPDWVAGIQNGMAKDDILAGVFGADAVVGATTIIGARRPEDGSVIFNGPGRTYFGPLGEREALGLAETVNSFNAAGLPCDLVDDVRSAEWSKAANAAAGFATALLSRAPLQQTATTPELVAVFVSLVGEVAAIAAAEGVSLGNYEGFPALRYATEPLEETVARMGASGARMPADRPMLLSMHSDLVAGRSLEVEEVFGDLVRRAERHGVAAPRLELAYRVIRAIDPGRAGA